MSEQPEAKFKRALREGFEGAYGAVCSFNTFLVASLLQKAGLPDQYFAVHGKTAWIEAKCNGNGLNKAQAVVLPKMIRAGARVAVVHTAWNLPPKDRIVSVAWADPATWEFPATFYFEFNTIKTPIFWSHVLGIA